MITRELIECIDIPPAAFKPVATNWILRSRWERRWRGWGEKVAVMSGRHKTTCIGTMNMIMNNK